MTRAWAPNGYDVVEWPAGQGLCVLSDVADDEEDAKARIEEGLRAQERKREASLRWRQRQVAALARDAA